MERDCVKCGKSFYRKKSESKKRFEMRKFCSRSCSISWNNLISPRQITISPNQGISICERCSSKIPVRRYPSGGYARRKYCDDCFKAILAEHGKSQVENILFSGSKYEDLATSTKKEVFASRKNWQSARSSIRRHACYIYKENLGKHRCFVCGYSKHVEICHIKPVSSFSDTALISEINDFSNLIALCPNHHWEFDNGLLQLFSPDMQGEN